MKSKHKIELHPLGKTFEVNDGTPLIDFLHEYGVEFPCGGKGTCGKCKVKVLEGNIETSLYHTRKIKELNLSDDWRLACLSKCTDDLILHIEQFNHLILADETEFSFVAEAGYGVAVDLGTTTLVAQLINLQTAEVMAVETRLNPQLKFGADLISRIQHALQGEAETMKRLIRDEIGKMIALMLQKTSVPLSRISIVGNSVMQLLFAGKDVAPLAAYPFETNDLCEKLFDAEELGWNFNVKEGVVFYPSIGSFVGSDILAGIFATGIHQKSTPAALIDLGTNGEIVVGNKDRIFCASTAAGPAFEGSNISMGMRATTGAISSLSWNTETGIKAEVIGKTKAKGICGSALIDAIALLKSSKQIDMFGLLASGDNKINISGDVFLSQEDINKFLLAKAAIASGIQILAEKFGIKVDDINDLYIAGGFGNYVNTNNVSKTGLISADSEKIHKIGNSALIGAKMFLFSGLEEVKTAKKKIFHVNLEKDLHFQDIYVDNMMLAD